MSNTNANKNTVSTVFDWDKNNFYWWVDAYRNSPVMSYVQKYIPKDKLVLEAGCGMGHVVKSLSEIGYNAVGIEINADAVASCNELEPTLDVRVGDVADLQYADGYFGGIISLGVVEHFIDGPEKPLAEMYRVLQSGGTGIISVPCFNRLRMIKKMTGLTFADYYLRRLYHTLRGKDVSWLYAEDPRKNFKYKYNRWPLRGKFFEYRFTKKEFERFLQDAGFTIVERVAYDGLGGLYHELGGVFVNLAHPSRAIRLLHAIFSNIPFFHNHSYLCIVRK